jgi:F plasmid transfer operon, TraF, protein
MAGAATAVADDGAALWTNPAGFARDPRLDAGLLAGGVATSRNDFTATVDRLSSIDFSRLDPAGIASGVADLRRLAAPGTGVVGSGVAGLVLAKGGWALGVGDLAFAGVYPSLDLVRVLPGNDSATGFFNNQSALSFAGLEAREARLAYATSFFGKVLLVGATARYIQGRTYFERQRLFDVSTTDPAALAQKALKENGRDTSRFAFDVGAMLNILGKARVGLVSTAVNEPEFSVKNDPANPSLAGAPATIRLPRTLRMGVAAEPIGMLTLAADYDLRQTDTLVPGGKSRQLSFGAEVRFPFFAVRAGAFRDSAAPDPHWAYSAGFGLGVRALSVNAAVVFSSEGGVSLSSTNRRDVGAALDARFRF